MTKRRENIGILIYSVILIIASFLFIKYSIFYLPPITSIVIWISIGLICCLLIDDKKGLVHNSYSY